MPPVQTSTSLTITNPLILYRTLLAAKRLEPDPSQHRLVFQLQKLYYRLKDYEPEVEYGWKIGQIGRALGRSGASVDQSSSVDIGNDRWPGLSLAALKSWGQKPDTLALTRKLTSHESAMELQSPKGLLLYGEVGTGKSMLVDLLADCLPTRKKRQWHFNTFMLETFARLEQLRRDHYSEATTVSNMELPDEEYSLLRLARDLISTSPIIFLDEFQLPDRATSKILSNLLTSFFHLGGVLIATSNRIPEELMNTSGMQFSRPPSSGLGILGHKLDLFGPKPTRGQSEHSFSGKGDSTRFLEVLYARCEVWDMKSRQDWRRNDAKAATFEAALQSKQHPQRKKDIISMPADILSLSNEQNVHTEPDQDILPSILQQTAMITPKYYFVTPSLDSANGSIKEEFDEAWEAAVMCSLPRSNGATSFCSIPWRSTTIRVYGRDIRIPRQLSGITLWTFPLLCASNLGPADYISVASAFHTLILIDVPVLNLLQKNEARRFITLLDALYEARCKLLIRAEAGPDDIFFPETKVRPRSRKEEISNADETYAETFSEIYQDQTSPFRPNISPYNPSSSAPSYDFSPLPQASNELSSSDASRRSILADEDSDFGPVYSASHFSSAKGHSLSVKRCPQNVHGSSNSALSINNSVESTVNFQRTGMFTGEDERFAYKRARSRLWEMCGSKWWSRDEEGWWKPLSRDVRKWEGILGDSLNKETIVTNDLTHLNPDISEGPARQRMDAVFQSSSSPFRKHSDPPPNISWVHAWGMMKWGKKAGLWGKGVEGLEAREKQKRGEEEKRNRAHPREKAEK